MVFNTHKILKIWYYDIIKSPRLQFKMTSLKRSGDQVAETAGYAGVFQMSLSLATLSSSLGGSWEVPRQDGICNPSCEFWVYCRVPYQLDVPGRPPTGRHPNKIGNGSTLSCLRKCEAPHSQLYRGNLSLTSHCCGPFFKLIEIGEDWNIGQLIIWEAWLLALTLLHHKGEQDTKILKLPYLGH